MVFDACEVQSLMKHAEFVQRLFIENNFVVLYTRRKTSRQVFDLFSDLHQAIARGRGKGKLGNERGGRGGD